MNIEHILCTTRGLVGAGALLALLASGCYSGASAGRDEAASDEGDGAGGQGTVGGEGASSSGGTDDGEPWEPGGQGGECAADERVAAHVYVRRVKMILTGEAPTEDEVTRVTDDPAVMRELVAGWVETEAFRDKLRKYLQETLQLSQGGPREYVSQVSDRDNVGGFRPTDLLFDNLNESFVRTALTIVDERRPFSEIASTTTWMMTTGMIAYLLATDRVHGGDVTYYRRSFSKDGITFNASTPLQTQIEHRTFHAPDLHDGCEDPTTNRNPEMLLTSLMRLGAPNGDCSTAIPGLFEEADFSDWREVELLPLEDGGEQPRFWDGPTLRTLDAIALRAGRGGFFSSPAFLAGWRTNVDNSFRVTTNQTLIVALGLAFEDSDVTTPLGDEGLAAEHAEPGTQCYGCHKNLDPMRLFFDEVLYPDSYAVRALEDMPGLDPSFSFQGHTSAGETLADFGAILAEHPAFAAGWTQKLCYLANSRGCDTNDPEFLRVVGAFEDSGLDFKTLVVELFSSSLVTGADCTEGSSSVQGSVSITRKEHLCSALRVRLGIDACNLSNTVRDLADALPADAWGRGSTIPTQPATSSLFYSATVDSLCERIGEEIVNADGSPIQDTDPEGSLAVLLESVMGLTPADPRYELNRTILQEHLEAAAEVTDDTEQHWVSAFTLACTSPYVVSTDF